MIHKDPKHIKALFKGVFFVYCIQKDIKICEITSMKN